MEIVGKRHLSYHVYPVKGNGVWQRRVRQLVRRWPLFTGLKVIAVAIDGRTDKADAVRAMLPADAEVMEFANDPENGEGVSWNPRWDRILKVADDADAALYAHAKGVTRPEPHFQEWGDVCLSAVCDHWPAVAGELRSKPICGTLPQVHGPGWCGVEGCDWHYSGTFYWLRIGALRAADRTLTPAAGRWGVEAWPGGAFRSHEAGNVGIGSGEAMAGDRNTAAGWAVVMSAWEQWERANPPKPPTTGIRLHVVTPVTRSHLLGRVADGLQSLAGFDWRWHAVGSAGGTWGGRERNEAIARRKRNLHQRPPASVYNPLRN